MPIILHIDMDSYFASVEQEFNQKLAGKPVGVLKALGRTCVIAASREAKKFGIKTGTSVWDAKALCPQITFVSADFNKYFSVTKKFIKICENFSPYIEVFSIDELFMDITLTAPLFGDYLKLCQKIKEQIRKNIGQYITCSIGISYNRLLAKLASGLKKPDGIFEINKDNLDEVLFSVDLTDMCGIGRRLEKRLLAMGIKDLKTIRQIPLNTLKAEFGLHTAKQLKDFSFGEDNSTLTNMSSWTNFENLGDPKSVSRTFTLFQDTTDEKKIHQTLLNLCDEVGFKLRKMRMEGRQFGLGIRGDNQGEYIHETLKTYTANSPEIFKIVWCLYKSLNWQNKQSFSPNKQSFSSNKQSFSPNKQSFSPNKQSFSSNKQSFSPNSVRFLGVWAGLLSKNENLTMSLFPEEQKKTKLNLAVDKINNKFGGFTLYPATLLGGELIRPEVNGYLGDKKYQLGF